MHFAFSTVACPTWDFETIVNRAKEYGYDGVEIRGFLNESILTASNVFLTDAKKLRSLFHSAGVEICCLASSIAMTGHKKADARLADDARRFIDTASEVGCGLAKVFEVFDRPIFAAGRIVSGHTLKHLAAATGVAIIERMLMLRQPKSAPGGAPAFP